MPLVSRYKCHFYAGKCSGLCTVVLLISMDKNKWISSEYNDECCYGNIP